MCFSNNELGRRMSMGSKTFDEGTPLPVEAPAPVEAPGNDSAPITDPASQLVTV